MLSCKIPIIIPRRSFIFLPPLTREEKEMTRWNLQTEIFCRNKNILLIILVSHQNINIISLMSPNWTGRECVNEIVYQKCDYILPGQWLSLFINKMFREVNLGILCEKEELISKVYTHIYSANAFYHTIEYQLIFIQFMTCTSISRDLICTANSYYYKIATWMVYDTLSGPLYYIKMQVS